MKEQGSYGTTPLALENIDLLEGLYAEVNGPTVRFDQSKFFRASGDLAALGHLALRTDGRAAAFYGVFPMDMVKGESLVRAAQSGATMTAPSDQGRGLFTLLAKSAFESAEAAGVEFVFGFPNRNSYPGFIRRLGWSHRRTMTSRVWPAIVPRSRRTILEKRQALSGSELISTQLRSGVVLESSLATSEWGYVLRGDDFVAGKSSEVFTIRHRGFLAYCRIGRRALEIGDLVIEPGEKAEDAVSELREFATIAGRPFVTMHISPGSAIDRRLVGSGFERNGLPYAHLTFRDENPDDYDFTWIDYDTF